MSIPQDYVSVDLETTGLNPKIDKIIEIGMVIVRDGQVEQEYSTLVNPYQQLRPETVELTGIRDEMLTDAPGISRVIEKCLELCGDLPLLGHKILFDYSFLKKAAVNEGMEFEKQGIDTLKLCRKFMPGAEKKKLSILAGVLDSSLCCSQTSDRRPWRSGNRSWQPRMNFIRGWQRFMERQQKKISFLNR